MMPCKATDYFQREKGIAVHFPVTHLDSPTVFETANSMMGSVLQLQGVPFDTEQNDHLNNFKQAWHQALLNIDEQFSVTVTTHRRKANVELKGSFKHPFLREINERYHHEFHQKSMYLNDIYLSVVSRGMMAGRAGSLIGLLSSMSSPVLRRSHERWREERRDLLDKVVNQLRASLASFGPRLLGEEDQNSQGSELLSFFSLFVNGGVVLPLRFPAWVSPLAQSIKMQKRKLAYYPTGHIAQYLSKRRIFFGDIIEFQGYEGCSSRYAVMVSVKRYATQTNTSIFDSLLKLDCEYISTNTFCIESKEVVQRLIGRHRRKLENVNDPARSQIKALEEAQDQVASDRIIMGHHHNTVMILADDLESLNHSVIQVIKSYVDVGFVAVRESIGQEPAFWAQIPGNIKMIARNALVTSENFVDFCPLHNYRSGYRDQNHLGSAVTILKTPSKTPYFFNFHVKGAKHNPSKGHTLIIGGNGCGKTVMMGFLDAQLSRYGGRTFVFDRDRGLEIYIRACGGCYTILSPENSNTIQFNPFQLADTAINRKFCREWFCQLVKEEGEHAVPAEVVDAITQCVDYVYEALPKEDRYLTNAAKLLPINFSRWPQLRRWLRSEGLYADGEYAYLFDNPDDQFQIYQKMGFDLTHFLNVESRTVLVALMMYLFHRLEQSFDGQLVSVLLDEGWQYLDDAYWVIKLKKWLPTLRKLNCHLILATQSPSSILNSSIKNMMMDNAATQIYFANPQAQQDQYQQGFNLTESEFRVIKENNPASRYFLLKQEHDSCLCQMDLSVISDLLPVFSANRKNLLLLDELRKKYGDDSKLWLESFKKKGALQ